MECRNVHSLIEKYCCAAQGGTDGTIIVILIDVVSDRRQWSCGLILCMDNNLGTDDK